MSHIDYNEDNPGPGTYWLDYRWVLPQAPIQSFGLRTDIWFDYGKPGPGTYNLRRDGNDSPMYTMAQHCHGVAPLNVPGPGTYFLHKHVKHTNIRVPAYTIAQKNNYFPWSGVPGPGTYNLREEVPEADAGYSLGKRLSTRAATSPGPGTYSPQLASGSPKYTIGQHLDDGSRPVTPGVGAYNLRSQEFAGPRYTMGRKFYRLRDMKRERRWSRALKQRPKPMRSASPQRGQNVNKMPVEEIHRKHSTHFHVKPEIPRRASSRIMKSQGVQVGAPGTEALPSLAAPAAEVIPVAPKSNAWMDIGKQLQRTRDAITAAAAHPEPQPVEVVTEPPPPE